MKAFKFNLKLITINTTPRIGFYVLIDNQICQITNIDTSNNTVIIDGTRKMPLSEIEGKIIKFLAECNSQTYNIVNSYFTSIVGFLYEEVLYSENVKSEDRKYLYFLDGLLDGENVYLMGIFEAIKTRTLPNEAVRITDLSIIDKFKLYEKESRIGIVKSFDTKSHLFNIKLNNGQEVFGRRDSFIKIGDKDIISMVKLQCPNCKR